MKWWLLAWWLLTWTASGVFAQNIQSLTSQIQKTPSAALFLERGTAYMEAGDFRQAIADFDRILDQDSINLRALELRGRAQSQLGRSANAITDLSGAIALSPADASLFLARADAYEAAGDNRHAIADREEALRLSPEIYNSWVEKERQAEQGDSNGTAPAAGATSAETASAPPAVPVKPSANTPAAAAASVAKLPPLPQAPKPEPAKSAPEPAKAPAAAAVKPPQPPKSAASESVTTLYNRGRDRLYKGELKQGLEDINRAIELQPKNAVLYNTRGFGYYLAKDYARAVQDFTQALQLDPNYLNAAHNRAMARKNSGDEAGYESDHQLEIELGRKQGVKVQ